MCPNCRAFITTDDKICPYCQAEVAPRAIDRRSPPAVGGIIPHARFTTMMILLVNTGLYVAMMLYHAQANGGTVGLDMDGKTLELFGGNFPGGEWWRLITAGYLHGGLLHILMNSWVLFDLGPQVDEAFGTPRYLILYFVSTITGYMASSYFNHFSVGASAGICGLIGAMIALHTRDGSASSSAMRRQYIQWVIYLLIFGFIVPNVDNAAHVGGLAGGFVLGFLIGTPRYSQAVESFWKIAAGGALALTAYAFLKMYLQLTATS
jgi:rhomboid protease GluP